MSYSKSQHPVEASYHALNALGVELKVYRLKNALFSWMTGQLFVTEAVLYERLTNWYRDKIELRSDDGSANKDTADRDFARLESEHRLFRKIMHIYLCRFAIKYLDSEIQDFS